MRIRHFSFSRVGGAGLVAGTLAQTQRLLGHDADFMVANGADLRTHPLRQPQVTIAASVDNYLIKKPNEKHQLSLFRSGLGLPIGHLLESKNPIEVAHLHWVEGLISQVTIDTLVNRDIKVVWTLHDMAPLTGGCHSNAGCESHTSGCQKCPLVRGPFQTMLGRNFQSKVANRTALRSLLLVAPSNWIASQAQKSKVFAGMDVHVIPNPIAPMFFETRSRKESRENLRVSAQTFVICVVAKNLDDPLKGVRLLTKVIPALSDELDQQVLFVFIGKASQELKSGFPSAIFTGTLEGEALANCMAACDVLVSTSDAESAGQTVQEAAALGVPAVVISNPGLLSTTILNSTAIAVSNDSEMTSVLIALGKNQSKLADLGSNARRLAIQSHNSYSVAERYLELYSL